MEPQLQEPNIHDVEAGILKTVSGQLVDVRNPQPYMFNSTDIAVGLSHECRFGGQLSTFYSVAQHSLMVYAMAPRELKLLALLHDAPEAYLKDIPKPLKVVLGSVYADIEKSFEQAIFKRFDVEQHVELIKKYDKEAVEFEDSVLRSGNHVDAHKFILFWHRKMNLRSPILSSVDARDLFYRTLEFELLT